MTAPLEDEPTCDDVEDTVRARIPSVAEITLEAVLDTLGRVAPSPRARELRARAEVYRLAIARRVSVRPTLMQRQVMRDLVSSLHDAVVTSIDRGRLSPRKR